MRTLTYVVGVSLDGYVCATDGSIDFFPEGDTDFHLLEIPEVVPTHVRAHFGLDAPNSRFDTMLQGRGSYELALREGITRPFAHMREFVFSRTLSADIDPTVTVVADDPLETVRTLKAEPGPLGICLVGGPSIAGLLLPEIDEILLKRYPVVAGSGKTLFEGAEYAPAAFERVDRHDIDGGGDYTLWRRVAQITT
ncbi:dihydrofolate reductase family protein [Microbacterium sp.]|uniref:dihydrofolate reductase family protein n=1 Tax=Microbacterium sp. TaxID=51671 RepID=UPI003F94EEFB